MAVQPPNKNALDVSAALVRTAEASPTLQQAPPATKPASASPIIGPGERPERAGLFQPRAELPATAGHGSGLGSTGGGGRRGSRGTTPFFGIVDVGSRFVYVIDCSGSMYSHNAMGAAKNELIRSLHTLNRFQQFQIVFYNTDQKWLKAPGKIDFRFFAADEKSLRVAGDFISETEAAGGTVHLAAINLALRLHPDVLFFLTDGGKPGLSDLDMDEIKRLNDRRTRIHCVQFSSADDPDAAIATEFLRKLAAQNDGEYVCRDVTRFDAPSTGTKTARAPGEER
jgi:Ca-activated chloride channel family protein